MNAAKAMANSQKCVGHAGLQHDRTGPVLRFQAIVLWNSAFLSQPIIQRSSRAFSAYCWSVSSPEACLPLSALWMAYRGSTMSLITTPSSARGVWRLRKPCPVRLLCRVFSSANARVSVTLPIKAVPPSRC